MERFVGENPLRSLLIAVGIVVVGRLVDLQWHLTHDEFEGAADQIRAHTVAWIGVLLVLAVTVLALRHGAGTAYRVALAGALLYVPVAVWHFIEHANGNDQEVAHVLLTIANIAIITGAAVAAVAARRTEAAGLSEQTTAVLDEKQTKSGGGWTPTWRLRARRERLFSTS